MDNLVFSLHKSMTELSAQEWNICAGAENPFVCYEFLSALEESRSVTPENGWISLHATLQQTDGSLIAAIPLYGKMHSYGEYVFDHGWARAYEDHGGQYYPKLQCAVPFSPVPGPRLLISPHGDYPSQTIISILGKELARSCQELQLSSAHITFCQEEEYTLLGKEGWLQRLGVQYHWHNQGFKDFEAFLNTLSSRKRKSIRKERKDIHASGLIFKTYQGQDITPSLWNAFYQFYLSTVEQKWGQAYLTKEFFFLLSQKMGDKVVLFTAEYNGQPVAGALNLLGEDTLYGRNWGSLGHWPYLHFELCYYQAIEFAIQHNLKHVEAGAQGEHKIQRGYAPQYTYSLHWIQDPILKQAIERFLAQEQLAVKNELDYLSTLTPFRKNEN
ncbi:GNAT family N-acetyltransferase [Entomobacter blattae]|uniref:Peptidogalycan biosysnthesis/recognition n=1 Tax=Entomobacter blattae TaxID=2762277 RepID=A0A7H1NQ66_9PROT|nr:GNAT family N-acetyltransferase [Entomobacter blattae]QNT77926.1 Peptidogalycan biosysnthesis/recognition [Entomobacter blattae]